jgi:glycosyltransferase involved in cell wall biosynthesis
MRIVHVNYVYDSDLVEPEALLARYSTLTGWSEALAAADDSQVVVVQRFGSNARLSRNHVDYVFCADGAPGAPSPLTRRSRLQRAVVEARPDLVHVNGLEFSLQTMFLRRSLPSATAVIVQDHASGSPRAKDWSPVHSLRRFVRRWAMGSADAFFFTAADQANPWRLAGYIAPQQPVYQVPEASTAVRPVSRTVARRETDLKGDPALLWVGRLNANKDPLTVIDAFAHALTALPGATLTMIFATDDLLPAVRERLSGSSQLAERIRLVGRVPHDRMAAFYSAADIFVLGSHQEGSGYALLEACACGLPPVVTDIPTFRVITDEGAIGALWTPGDVKACASALRRVARRDRPAGRERVIGHFDRSLSWPAVARSARAAYLEACARRRSEFA